MAGNVQAAESESRGRAYGPALDEHDLVAQFEGLGDNVEFGCVQRTCGAEPLGLFRFSFSCKIAPLCHAFETGLEHLFTGEDLDVILDCGDGRFYCRSRYYDDFFYFVYTTPGTMTVEEVTIRERKKQAYLRRRLLEDLKNSEKIFVRR